MTIIRYLPIVGRAQRAEAKHLEELINKLRKVHHVRAPYVDGAGEICAPELHAPVYSFTHPMSQSRIAAPQTVPFDAADTAWAEALRTFEAQR